MLKKIKLEHVEAYLAECKNQDKSDASIGRYHMSIRAFCGAMIKRKLLDRDIARDAETPKVVRKLPRIPSKEEIVALLNAPDETTEVGARDKAILELFYSCGIRVSELCALEVDDVFDDKAVIKSGKGNKQRSVPITGRAMHYIHTYLQNWRGIHDGPLFVNDCGRGMRRQHVAEQVGKYAHDRGLKNITPHILRHAFASHMIEAGASLILIKEILGHSTVATTQIYTQICSEEQKTMHKKFHPLSEYE